MWVFKSDKMIKLNKFGRWMLCKRYTNTQKRGKNEKKQKKGLTKVKESDKIYKLTAKSGKIQYPKPLRKKTLKKLEKSFAKGIDKVGRIWYNERVAV